MTNPAPVSSQFLVSAFTMPVNRRYSSLLSWLNRADSVPSLPFAAASASTGSAGIEAAGREAGLAAAPFVVAEQAAPDAAVRTAALVAISRRTRMPHPPLHDHQRRSL